MMMNPDQFNAMMKQNTTNKRVKSKPNPKEVKEYLEALKEFYAPFYNPTREY